jgi:hypothetical protein
LKNTVRPLLSRQKQAGGSVKRIPVHLPGVVRLYGYIQGTGDYREAKGMRVNSFIQRPADPVAQTMLLKDGGYLVDTLGHGQRANISSWKSRLTASSVLFSFFRKGISLRDVPRAYQVAGYDCK